MLICSIVALDLTTHYSVCCASVVCYLIIIRQRRSVCRPCPYELIEKYEDLLLEYFEQKQHKGDELYERVVSNGGVVNIYKGPQEQKPKKPITTEQIIGAIGKCSAYLWGYSSLAVIYCVCTKCYSLPENMSHFEKEMNRYDVKCPAGTIDSTIRKNAYLRYPIDQWEEKGAKERVMKLVGAFRQAVDGK